MIVSLRQQRQFSVQSDVGLFSKVCFRREDLSATVRAAQITNFPEDSPTAKESKSSNTL